MLKYAARTSDGGTAMASDETAEKNNELVTSYLRVRSAVGALAFILPVMLWVSAQLFETVDFVPSISEFFYTPMREALVGTIGAIAVFLISYKGYSVDPEKAKSSWAERWLTDRSVSYAAAIGALGVAVFPTRTCIVILLEPEPLAFAVFGERLSGTLHVVSAGLFFLSLAVFCLSNFRRGGAKARQMFLGMSQDRFYFICGLILIACIVALGLVSYVNHNGSGGLVKKLEDIRIIFWVETIGLFTFSAAWLTKGKALSTVPNAIREMVGRAPKA